MPKLQQVTMHSRSASAAQRFREKINAGQIRDRLEKCVRGEIEMTSSQLTAARILLDRCVPVLKATEVIINGNDIRDITHLQGHGLLDLIEGQAERIDAPKTNGKG